MQFSKKNSLTFQARDDGKWHRAITLQQIQRSQRVVKSLEKSTFWFFYIRVAKVGFLPFHLKKSIFQNSWQLAANAVVAVFLCVDAISLTGCFPP